MSLFCKFPIWFICLDAYGWGIHYLYHHSFLWKYHKVHHAQYAWKFHWIELVLNWGVTSFASILFMGFPFTACAVLYTLFESRRGHMAVDVPPDTKSLIVTTAFHKAHHDNPNINYGQITKLFDFLFGTIAKPVQATTMTVHGGKVSSFPQAT